MPLYEYECSRCGERFEVLQKFSDDPLTDCRVCGGPLRKLISSPAIQFKGTGWYVTDYARSSTAKEQKTDGSAGGGEGSSSGKAPVEKKDD